MPHQASVNIEELAAALHDLWVKWAGAIMDSEQISLGRRQRWAAYMVPYEQLSEAAKDKDRDEALAVLGRLITISPFSKVPVDHGQDGPRCASCLGDLIWNENGVGHFEKIPLVKIVPLGCPDCSIGGFIWQCPKCKTVTADWKAL
jgi:predicted RNA-binding Zn-ribbon protein involved in translation (DUF1610 family)